MTLHISITPKYKPVPPPVEYPPLYRVLHDVERPENFWLTNRFTNLSFKGDTKAHNLFHFVFQHIMKVLWRKKVPEVYFMTPIHLVKLNEKWQRLTYDLFLHGAPNLDPSLHIKRWRSLYGCHRAFSNNKGFDCRKDPPHGPFRDYITGADLSESLPALDKPRFCGGATLSGVEDGEYLIVETLNQPVTLDYLLARPWLYFHATVVLEDGSIIEFPQGDGEPVLVPLVSEVEVKYPLKYLQRVNEIADPYKIYL